MRTLDNNQKYHFLLTYYTSTLVRWYNKYICDPYGDFKEQTIRDFTEEEENAIKKALYMEKLVDACKHPNTKIVSGDLYICVTGGENPYIISFSTFEGFLNAITEEDKEGFMEFLNDELLEDLENERIEEQKEWAELDKKEQDRIVDTCICPFRIEGKEATSVNDDDFYYELPSENMTDAEIQAFFEDIKKMEK